MKKILLSYSGKIPIDVALPSMTLTLRPNSTAVVSDSDLELVTRAVEVARQQRHLVVNGPYSPRSQRAGVPTVSADKTDTVPGKASAVPKSRKKKGE